MSLKQMLKRLVYRIRGEYTVELAPERPKAQ